MKRKTILTLITVCILSFASCGKQETTATTETIPTTVESEATQQTETYQTNMKEVRNKMFGLDGITASEDKSNNNESESSTIRTDYPDSRSDHQANWDIYKNYFDDFSVYGTDTAGKEYNDLPYCGDTGYDPKGTILQERTTDKGYTVLYDTNTGKVYYSSMILPTGSGYDEEKSSNALVQYILDNDIFSVYDLTYAQFQELLGVYNGD